jgi:hypothetical protein
LIAETNQLNELQFSQWKSDRERLQEVRVNRSTKTGIASALLFAGILIPPYREWRAPVSVAFAVLACVLGVLAATSGRKWWLIIPGSIVAGFALDLYLVIYAL